MISRTLILFDCHLEETSGRASLSRLQNLQTLELVRCQPQDTRSLMASIGQLSGRSTVFMQIQEGSLLSSQCSLQAGSGRLVSGMAVNNPMQGTCLLLSHKKGQISPRIPGERKQWMDMSASCSPIYEWGGTQLLQSIVTEEKITQ